VTVLRGAPTIENASISPVYEFDHIEALLPEQDITVRCNVTSVLNVKNVTLYWIDYPIGSAPPETWYRFVMVKSQGNEWVGSISGQPAGRIVAFYLEAFSSINISSRTGKFVYEVVDLTKLEIDTKITTLTVISVLIVGCVGIFALKRRKILEEL